MAGLSMPCHDCRSKPLFTTRSIMSRHKNKMVRKVIEEVSIKSYSNEYVRVSSIDPADKETVLANSSWIRGYYRVVWWHRAYYSRGVSRIKHLKLADCVVCPSLLSVSLNATNVFKDAISAAPMVLYKYCMRAMGQIEMNWTEHVKRKSQNSPCNVSMKRRREIRAMNIFMKAFRKQKLKLAHVLLNWK